LAQRLLGFSRHRVLDLQPLILTEFARDALDTLRRGLPANIEVQFEADEEGGVVEADPAAVKQILLHLVTNARDAMQKGGTLHVEVRRARLGAADRPLHAWVEPGSYVSVALSDTGVGMDAETLARVFEPFFTTKPVGVGTGLGMSMAYGLVKQHRGYLHIYSEVGQGTTAKVYLPAVRDRGMSEFESVADESLPGGTEAILLVEDDQTMRFAAARPNAWFDPAGGGRSNHAFGRAAAPVEGGLPGPYRRRRPAGTRRVPRPPCGPSARD